VAPEIAGALLLRDGRLELRDLSGSLAGGRLRGRGRVLLDNPSRNYVSLFLDRADAARLFAPVPDLGDVVAGQVSLEVRGSFGREIRGAGTVTLARGSIGGVGVTELRVPFDYATAPGGYGRVVVREARALAGYGRATGGLTVEWGGGTRVAGQVRFLDVPLGGLSPALGENRLFGGGRITGRFDLAGTNVRSADDLTGLLIAQFNNTSAREIPLLQQAVPYLNPIGATKPFQTGDVRGRLVRGVFRVERLALVSPTAQLFAEGAITVQNGRLDLDVVANTGQVGPDVRGLRLLGLRLPVFGPIPLSLIRDVSAFLSNRTVRLTITGTTANPVVRVNTGALLREEAVRFFLTRYVLPAELAGWAGIGTAGGLLGGTSGNGNGGTMTPGR
jgi:translocation and assembly module TamB